MGFGAATQNIELRAFTRNSRSLGPETALRDPRDDPTEDSTPCGPVRGDCGEGIEPDRWMLQSLRVEVALK
jgi:hypothetical protein